LFSAVLADGAALPDWMELDPVTGHIMARPPLDYLGTQSVNFTLSDGTTTQSATATYALDGNVGVSFVYTPDPAYDGDDSLVYAITDDKQAPVQATVDLKVLAALVAKDDDFSLDSDTAFVIDPAALLANDVSADGSSLTLVSVTSPSHGTLSFDGSNYSYTSTHYFGGLDQFQYSVTDNNGHTQTANVNLHVTSIDHAPIAVDDHFDAVEDSPLTIEIADLLANDSDQENDPISFVSITPDGGTPARALVIPGGRIQFVPDPLKYGDMGFSYVVTDGTLSSTGHVDVNFAKINHAPIGVTDGVFTVQENTPFRVSLATLTANDVDVDGDAFTLTSVLGGVNGNVVIDGDEAVFTPRFGYSGNAAFLYTVTDSLGAIGFGRVNLEVLPTYHLP
ncbi:MAG TPA: tandem-95 repeat protein, partial [Planctomycetaceae bacterium]|nr:tandem-95 repeat protein [Planctomycetaceae bacterium]